MTLPKLRPIHVAALLTTLFANAFAAEIRIGMVGLDTSHAVVFPRLLNDPKNKDHIDGAKVVAAVRAPSADVQSSITRVDNFVAELKKDPNITFYDSIADMLPHVDAVMIEAVDGRPHLAQAKEVFGSKKPLWVDKPAAGSLRDAVELYRLAKESGTPCFSASSLRFTTLAATKDLKVGEVRGASSFGPCELEPHHPDLFWYGIHTVEIMYAVLGRGCVSVVRTHTPNTDVVTGVWEDGRVGTVRGLRGGKSSYGLTVFGSTAVANPEVYSGGNGGYRRLIVEVLKFFQTGVAPVSPDDTLEVLAFMEAADESKRRGGAPVKLADVMAAATARK
jgi:predicted dehydrogenase